MKDEKQNDNDDDQTGADDNQDVCFLLVDRSAKWTANGKITLGS